MSLLNSIETLYRQLPTISCEGCGLCCVSPTCTLSEFIYLFDYLQHHYPEPSIARYLSQPIELHPSYEGNVRCIFLTDNRCTVYPARTGACRLFGIPSLKELGLADMEQCRNDAQVTSGAADIEFIQSWLEKIVNLDKTLYSYMTSPYFVNGFTIQCWLDIYFDSSLDFDVFSDIRKSMRIYLDLSRWEKYPILKTGLKEKIDKISILSSMLNSANPQLLRKLLFSIRDDYPFTGTYFYDETQAYLSVLNSENQ